MEVTYATRIVIRRPYTYLALLVGVIVVMLGLLVWLVMR